MPWREDAEKELARQKLAGAMAWLPKSTKVIEQPGQHFEGAFGTVPKVRIARSLSIPADVDFAGKRPKVADMRMRREEVSLEAMACAVVHLGVVKMSFIRQGDYEGYTLWWNGGSLQSFQARMNNKVEVCYQ
jgi:hypothetical protein